MELQPVDLYYEEAGRGIPVVLIHGFPMDHTIWHRLVPLLENEARLIMPDLRGHGRSPVEGRVSSMRLMAEDVVRLLDRLNIDQAIVVGQSMGGYVALAFANAYPGRLAGLGLVASQAAADLPEKRQNRLKQVERIRRRGSALLAESMPAVLSADPNIQQFVREIILKTDARGITAALRGMAERANAEEWLAEISAPAVVIHGGQDALISMEPARTAAQLLSRAWLVELPTAGHMPMMEDPQAVADAIRQLICAVVNCRSD